MSVTTETRTRRRSIPVRVGDVVVGGAAPIAVQTMTKTDTRDVGATLAQIAALKEAGCEIVRPAVPDHHAAEALKEIVPRSPLPVIADIHYDHRLALMAIEAGVHGLRLNPGNIPDRDKVERVVRAAKERDISFRIGVNAGSLPEEVHRNLREAQAVDRDDRMRTAERMVEVALRRHGLDLPYYANHLEWRGDDRWRLTFPHCRAPAMRSCRRPTACARVSGPRLTLIWASTSRLPKEVA